MNDLFLPFATASAVFLLTLLGLAALDADQHANQAESRRATSAERACVLACFDDAAAKNGANHE